MNRLVVVRAFGAATLLVAEVAFVSHTVHAKSVVDARRRTVAAKTRELADTDASVAERTDTLRRTSRDVSSRKVQQQTAQRARRVARQYQATAARDLADAKLLSSQADAGVDGVRSCVHGVARATLDSRGGDTAGAISALRASEAACMSVFAAEGDSSVFPFDFSDPAVLRVGNVYYAYATNGAAGNMPVIESTDLRHWTIDGNALPKLASWALPNSTWAPGVVRLHGQYVAYYTARDSRTWDQCISVAIARAPTGPFVDTSRGPLVCQHELGGSIDPRPFVDASGRPWLLWKSEAGRLLPAIIWSQPLAPGGRALVGSATLLISADQQWEHRVVEAPALVADHGTFILFYSGNSWSSPDYAVGEARCASPAGPCVKRGRDPAFASHDDIAGPGTADFFTSPSGELWMAYDAYRVPNVGYPSSRLLHVAQVHVDGDRVTFTP